MTQLCGLIYLRFHSHSYAGINFTGGVPMKETIFVLAEQRLFNTKDSTNTLIQQAITAWLTKELCK